MISGLGFGLQTFYSIKHLKTSIYFVERAKEIECSLTSNTGEAVDILHSYVTGALFSSVAFLEALANEMFAEASKSNGGCFNSLETAIIDKISDRANSKKFEQVKVLDKLNLLLELCGHDKLTKGGPPYQHTKTLIDIRNQLMHYKASFLDIGTEGMVRPGSFGSSDLARFVRGLFPDRKNFNNAIRSDGWIGFGCANWALKTARNHADLIHETIGIEPYYSHVTSRVRYV
ncbi:hypothetical protein J3L16_08435 [Alteromonas sp. 5E99-2]|uniref:hypothetical protein n=1 Tax=Alteromonas sp. 5E99-2 TaxID=2817683 RepID=UPI001A999D35|nr:hypothetical protein [Alteromonas sp. 5E99-2]MBO1255709.1 hypothetical protein [Alteromonas sp. 5E99-2]